MTQLHTQLIINPFLIFPLSTRPSFRSTNLPTSLNFRHLGFFTEQYAICLFRTISSPKGWTVWYSVLFMLFEPDPTWHANLMRRSLHGKNLGVLRNGRNRNPKVCRMQAQFHQEEKPRMRCWRTPSASLGLLKDQRQAMPQHQGLHEAAKPRWSDASSARPPWPAMATGNINGSPRIFGHQPKHLTVPGSSFGLPWSNLGQFDILDIKHCHLVSWFTYRKMGIFQFGTCKCLPESSY